MQDNCAAIISSIIDDRVEQNNPEEEEIEEYDNSYLEEVNLKNGEA